MKLCPCNSGDAYVNCCGKFIAGNLSAPTPEALMRSRYTAYTRADTDYIERTMKGKALEGYDKEESKLRASKTSWLGLEVLNASESLRQGWVEFKAYFLQAGQKRVMHERSEFIFEAGCWYYVDGVSLEVPFTKAAKVGRNDPCTCGSEKKFKKCCGSAC